jgi:small ubiquitin-related modifier
VPLSVRAFRHAPWTPLSKHLRNQINRALPLQHLASDTPAAHSLASASKTANMADNGAPAEEPAQTEHLNIKVTDSNNEVFFKIKRTTPLKKLMDAFCERQGKSPQSVRFLFDGQRVNPTDNPETVRKIRCTMLIATNDRCV